jgi:hypothetical protein
MAHSVSGSMSCLTVTCPVSPPAKFRLSVAFLTSSEFIMILFVKSKEMTPAGRMNSKTEF